ncbi:DUF4328 domain-containing protein [Streptomyces sp. H10-C2]|uniref:DUF4328 domain-containing protein n=1 Tax=unclassified Streptomyces TaxID=2593676 RepID=UPI0024BB77D9|nr:MULTISPECIES: DUF4328 domain-containing protein [unclassified Streptomyces]MDJ0341361.1 DUF4328 domain-containing protein [Streptomyces sp. PH10-H1]MDJ0370956.1 DUF4328 domain-containing protein [Streptomyces sp. H10-C2]
MSMPLAERAPKYATNLRLRPARAGGLGMVATVLLGITGVLDVLVAVSDAQYRSDLSEMSAAAGTSPIRAHAYLSHIDTGFHRTTQFLYALAITLTTVAFLLWFRRVRANAEVMAPGLHRRSPGWAIGGWFAPVGNLWIPKQTIDDIVESTDPASGPRRLVNAWWAAWIVVIALTTVSSFYKEWAADEASFTRYADTGDVYGKLRDGTLDVQGWAQALQTSAILDIVTDLATAGAAVFAILTIRELSRIQDTRLGLNR